MYRTQRRPGQAPYFRRWASQRQKTPQRQHPPRPVRRPRHGLYFPDGANGAPGAGEHGVGFVDWWSGNSRATGHDALRRELYFFSLYRLLEAGLLAFLAFSPFGEFFVVLEQPFIAQTAAVLYLVAAVLLLAIRRDPERSLSRQAGTGVIIDIAAAAIAIHTMTGLESGIALLLVINIGAAAILMSLPSALLMAALGGCALLLEFFLAGGSAATAEDGRSLAEPVMFAISYLGIALFTHQLGQQMRASQKLVEQRDVDLANLAQVNELIIRRMRTGLLVVDDDNRVRMFNESAWHLLGNPPADERRLGTVAPELSRRLWGWRQGRPADTKPVALAEDVAEVIPRFTLLGSDDQLVLIFLEDTTLFSRKAEQLTLNTLGRLSASIAHEIRNPLAAISYSAQLLEECEVLPEADRRLVEIINTQCTRMNGIVQNILGMARRERAQPEPVELALWVKRFVDEYKTSQPLEAVELNARAETSPIRVLVDSQQLHQIVTILVSNAITYGRLPGEPARISVVANPARPGGTPGLSVIDRGPGIPPKVVESIFEPFFTTSEHGTGLGLYIAHQLCEANQATLAYETLAGGGSHFRIQFAKAQG